MKFLFYFFLIMIILFIVIYYKKIMTLWFIYLDNKTYNYNNRYDQFMKTDKIPPILPIFKINTKSIINKSVCICICIKNCEKYLKTSFSKLELLFSIFNKSSVIFYENGSSDNSRVLLKKYCVNRKNAIIITEDYPIEKYPRTVRLARGRNICLNVVNKLNPNFYITLDFDNVIKDLSKNSILSIFKQNFKWDMLSANQQNIYYDIWALRTFDNWLKYDWVDNMLYYKNNDIVKKKYRNIPLNKIIPVISSFGGFAIYKIKALKNCYYYGFKNDKEVCEHVHFHKQMIKKNNSKLFILGSLINS